MTETELLSDDAFGSLAKRFDAVATDLETVTTLPKPYGLYYPVKNEGDGTGWSYWALAIGMVDIRMAADNLAAERAARIAAEAKLAAVEAERDKAREDALRDGWEACRRSIYAVCEDVDREADEARKHEGEHAKGYAAGMARAAKSIARGFCAMEAMDDDNILALAPAAVDRNEGETI